MKVCSLKNGALLTVLAHILILSPAFAETTSTTKKDDSASSTASTDSPDKKKDSKKEEATSTSNNVTEVVVTATRTETAIDKTGSSVSVISQEEIQRAQYSNVTDALRTVPGVAITSVGAAGSQSTFTVRGAATTQSIILINGHRVPQMFAGSTDLNNLPIENIERIEVVRGPSSILYGADAMGGVVNIITKDGRSYDKPTASAWFEGGTFNTFREGVSTSGKSGAFDYNVAGTHYDTTNQRNNNDYSVSSYNSNLGYTVNEDLRTNLYSNYTYYSLGLPNDNTTNDPAAQNQSDAFMVSPGVEWKTTDIWNQSLYITVGRQRSVDNSPLTWAMVGGSGSQYFQNTEMLDTRIDYQSDVQILDNLKLTQGLSIDNQDITYSYRDDNGKNISDRGDTRNSQGALLQAQWDILKDWTLTSGMRYDHYSDFRDAFTYRTAMSYRVPVARTLLHSNYGTSYRTPSYSDTIGAYQNNPNGLQPEKANSWEAGIEQPFFNDKLTIGSVYFENDYSNLISTNYGVTPAVTYNTQKAMTKGVENTIAYKATEWLTLSAAHTYLEAENQSTGKRLLRRPRNMLNTTITAQPIKALSVSFGTTWMMDREDYNPVTYANGNNEDYFTARFAISYDINDHFQVFGRIENLTNEQYADANGYPALDRGVYGGFKLTY